MIDVIKLRNDGFEGNTKKCAPLFFGKFEFFCWHIGRNVWPIIISENRPIVYTEGHQNHE